MRSSPGRRAPTRFDVASMASGKSTVKTRSAKPLQGGSLTGEDAALIGAFVSEIRANKITFALVHTFTKAAEMR